VVSRERSSKREFGGRRKPLFVGPWARKKEEKSRSQGLRAPGRKNLLLEWERRQLSKKKGVIRWKWGM